MLPIENIIDSADWQCGLVPHIDREHYRQRGGMNPSSLSTGLIGISNVDVRAIKNEYEADEKPRAQASQDRLDRGTVAHLMLLQPELIPSKVAVWDGGTRRGAEWDAFDSEHPRMIMIKGDVYRDLAATINEMRSEPEVAKLLRGTQPELSVFSREYICGHSVKVRGQVDAVRQSDMVIVDIKTTETGLDTRSVDNTIRTFHYREKMALYRRWVAMQTDTNPGDWTCFNLFLGIGDKIGIHVKEFDGDALEWGEDRMLTALAEVVKCCKSGEWPIFKTKSFASVAPWEIVEEEAGVH